MIQAIKRLIFEFCPLGKGIYNVDWVWSIGIHSYLITKCTTDLEYAHNKYFFERRMLIARWPLGATRFPYKEKNTNHYQYSFENYINVFLRHAEDSFDWNLDIVPKQITPKIPYMGFYAGKKREKKVYN